RRGRGVLLSGDRRRVGPAGGPAPAPSRARAGARRGARRPHGRRRTMTKQHAVVIGGSIAGLCAARVLTDYFDAVTVLDRDAYPAAALERAGVPQGRHVHALLAGGRRALERFFPGFDARMHAGGAHEIDFGSDIAALRPDGWQPREESGITTLFASRTLIETTVRELLRALPRVTLVERAAAVGLAA